MTRGAGLLAARATLEGIIAAEPALAGITVRLMLRARFNGIVARAERAGRSVILKHFPGASGPATVVALEAELARLAPRLSAGRCQVNRCLLACPAVGAVVLSDLPGERMSVILPALDPAERARTIADVGRFVLLYGEGQREMSRFAPGFWLAKLDGIDLAPLGARDRALMARLAAALEA